MSAPSSAVVKGLCSLRRMGVGHVVAPGPTQRLSKQAQQLDPAFRKRGVEALRGMGVEVEGAGVVPLAFVDASAGLAVDNSDLAFLGVPIVQLYVRSWLMQGMTSYAQAEVESASQYFLSPRLLASAYTASPVAEIYLASEDLRSRTEACLAQGTADPAVEKLLASQLYALAGALHVEKGIACSFNFLADHIVPGLTDI